MDVSRTLWAANARKQGGETRKFIAESPENELSQAQLEYAKRAGQYDVYRAWATGSIRTIISVG